MKNLRLTIDKWRMNLRQMGLCLFIAALAMIAVRPSCVTTAWAQTAKTFRDYARLAQGNDDVLLLVTYDPNGTPTTYSIGFEELIEYWAGSTNITTLGTVGTGTWNGTAIDHERGGLEANVSNYDGFVYITGGITSAKTQNAGTDVTVDLEEEAHAAEHTVSAADTVFPADPDADRVLLWDDNPGVLAWYDISGLGAGDMLKATYDISADGHVDGNDVAYGAAWNGDVNAPSMNAVYDEMETKGDIAGQTWSGTHNFSGATVSLPARQANSEHHFRVNLWNPNALYDVDTQICLCPALPAAITITKIDVTCDADPATEIVLDLKWADAFIGLANAAVIDELDTTNGVASIAAGFDDADIASGKCIYLEWQADPAAAITQVCVDVTYDYD